MKRADKRKEGVSKVQSFLTYWYFWARGMSDFLNRENGLKCGILSWVLKKDSSKEPNDDTSRISHRRGCPHPPAGGQRHGPLAAVLSRCVGSHGLPRVWRHLVRPHFPGELAAPGDRRRAYQRQAHAHICATAGPRYCQPRVNTSSAGLPCCLGDAQGAGSRLLDAASRLGWRDPLLLPRSRRQPPGDQPGYIIGPVTGRPQGIAPTMLRLPKPGHASWHSHRATTRDRPYYATASQAGACIVAKERFFTRKFHAMCHSPTKSSMDRTSPMNVMI